MTGYESGTKDGNTSGVEFAFEQRAFYDLFTELREMHRSMLRMMLVMLKGMHQDTAVAFLKRMHLPLLWVPKNRRLRICLPRKRTK